MGKILVIFYVFLLFFIGCASEQKLAQKESEEIPADVNISQSETNITIDEISPPEPVVEVL